MKNKTAYDYGTILIKHNTKKIQHIVFTLTNCTRWPKALCDLMWESVTVFSAILGSRVGTIPDINLLPSPTRHTTRYYIEITPTTIFDDKKIRNSLNWPKPAAHKTYSTFLGKLSVGGLFWKYWISLSLDSIFHIISILSRSYDEPFHVNST